MTVNEVTRDIQKVLGARIELLDIETNWKPHIYIIHNDTMKWMNKHCKGITSPENVATAERLLGTVCCHEDCGKRMIEHKFENICVLRLKANMQYNYALVRLQAMEKIMKAVGIVGYRWEKNDRGFKIAESKTKQS